MLNLPSSADQSSKAVSTVELRTGPNKGRVVWATSGNPTGRLTLVWDGDPNAGQISGSGLTCLNLLRDGATAFVLEDLAYTASCERKGVDFKGTGKRAPEECSPLTIESRIFDSGDPTGQRYSTSIIRRHPRLSGQDLRIPFSTFTREGPNGGASPTCVGAISITLKADELSKSVVTFGPFSTNGSCQVDLSCLKSSPPAANIPPAIATGSPSPQAPPADVAAANVSPSPSPSAAPALSPTSAPSSTPTNTPTVTPTPTPTQTTAYEATTPPLLNPNVSTSGSAFSQEKVAGREATVAPEVAEEVVYGDFIER